MSSNKKYIFILLISSLVAFLSINSHSFWVDECVRLCIPESEVFSDFFKGAAGEKQLLFHLSIRYWLGLTSNSEIVLRSFNVFFYLLAIIYTILLVRGLRLNVWWALIVSAHPFLIYYLNEYSAYMQLFACASGLLYHTYVAANRESWGHSLASIACMFVGYACHFVFGFAVFFYIAMLAYRWKEAKSIFAIRRILVASIAFIPLFLAITWIYYVNMEYGGDRGWPIPGLEHLAFVVYAFLGMQGLGLSRNDMRHGNFEVLNWEMLLLLCLMSGLLILLLCLQRKKIIGFICWPPFVSAVIGLSIFIVACCFMHFRYWERHCIWALPVALLTIARFLDAAWKSSAYRYLNRVVVILFALMLLTSSARLRCMYYYQKEDYKNTCIWVQNHYAQHGSTILLQGHETCFRYYRLEDNLRGISPNEFKLSIVESFKLHELLNLIEITAQENQSVCLVLSEKNEKTREFYDNPSYYLGKLDNVSFYEAQCFNTFKIVVLKRK